MTRPALDALGSAWLERGTISTRFLKPFYQDQLVTVRTMVTSADESGVTIELTAVNEAGETCAIGCSLPSTAPILPVLDEVPVAPRTEQRLPVSRDVLAEMSTLGTIVSSPEAIKADAKFLDEIKDDHPAYRGDGAVLHPGYLIRFANTVLSQAVQLGPWIHVSSDVHHFSTVRAGEGFATRARITELFERKGHKFVTLDVLQVSGDRPISRNTHTAIYDIDVPAPEFGAPTNHQKSEGSRRMALYEYRCPACNTTFEKRVPMSEVSQEMPCTNCGKPARKAIGSFAVLGRAEASFGDGPAPWEDGGDGAGDGDFDPSMEGIDF